MGNERVMGTATYDVRQPFKKTEIFRHNFPICNCGRTFYYFGSPKDFARDILQFRMKERVGVRKLTHWTFVPYLKAGHTNSGGAMTKGRMTYEVLSTALLQKLRQRTGNWKDDKHTSNFQSGRL